MTEKTHEADFIVVGTGPGGATVARALARAGKRVLILESGPDFRKNTFFGSAWGPFFYLKGRKPLITEDGVIFLRPHMVGGASILSAGNAAMPPAWLAERYRLDVTAEAQEVIEELNIAPLPESLRGQTSTRIAEAAGELGYTWEPQMKFMNPQRGDMTTCGAHCLLGCTCGAKWTAAEYVDEAVAAGARLETGVHVSRVLVEDGHVIGVQGHRHGRPYQALGHTVILAAGTMGTPRILHESGFPEAGLAFAAGISVPVYGMVREPVHMEQEPPMTWSWMEPQGRYMLSTFIEPQVYYLFEAWTQGMERIFKRPDWARTLGILVTLKDEISGGIYANDRMLKPLTLADRERLDEAITLARQILLRSGVAEDTLHVGMPRGMYPLGSVRVDFLVNERLETEIDDLYVCDASVLPEGMSCPPMLTIIALGRRLARQLLAEIR